MLSVECERVNLLLYSVVLITPIHPPLKLIFYILVAYRKKFQSNINISDISDLTFICHIKFIILQYKPLFKIYLFLLFGILHIRGKISSCLAK